MEYTGEYSLSVINVTGQLLKGKFAKIYEIIYKEYNGNLRTLLLEFVSFD